MPKLPMAPAGWHAVLNHDYVQPGEAAPVDPTQIAHISSRRTDTGVDVYWWTVEMDED